VIKLDREAAKMATIVTAICVGVGGALVGMLSLLIWTVENASPWVWGSLGALLGVAFIWVMAYILWRVQ
jgi:hypothetical protein